MNVSGAALILLLFSHTYAQLNPGAKQISLSHSDIASSVDVFSIYNNPAGLAQIRWREFGVYYSPAPFGFQELASSYLAYSEPLSFGAAALGAMTYGFKLYRETKVLAGFSYRVLENMYAGVSLSYHTVSISNYGKDEAIYFDLGTVIFLTHNFRWGACLHNINRSTFGKEEGQIPVVFNSGFSFEPLTLITLNAAFEKDLIYKPSIQFGVDYRIIEYISLRSGFATQPDKYSAGIGIFYSLFNVDYAVFTHPDLGLTHQAGLIIRFSRD